MAERARERERLKRGGGAWNNTGELTCLKTVTIDSNSVQWVVDGRQFILCCSLTGGFKTMPYPGGRKNSTLFLNDE